MKFTKSIAVIRVFIGLYVFLLGGMAYAADLQVSQYSADPDPIGSGAQATFSVTVANNSTPTVSNAVVTIAVPGNFEVAGTAGDIPSYCALSGTPGSQTLTCTLTTLPGGGVANARTFSFKATAKTPGASNSTATIAAAGNSDSNPGNDSLTITPTVRAGADIALVKAGSASSVPAGGILQYTLSATNNGPNTTAAIRVVDNLPAASDFQFQSATGSGWTCNLSGTTLTCDYSGSAPAVGRSFPAITISGKITKNTAGTISNIAAVSIIDPLVLDPATGNNISNTVVTNVQAGADLQAIKSMTSTITVGQGGSIVLSIRNTGPQTTPAGTKIADTIDSSLTIGALPSGCARSGQTVTCTASSIVATGQVDFVIPVTGSSATSGVLTNTAHVTPPSGFTDPDMSNNDASAPFQVVLPNADLELYSKSKSPSPVAPGADITSTIVVRNLGPSAASWTPATPIRVTDTLSADETYVSVSGNWSCSVSGVVVTCQTTDSGTLQVGDLLYLSLVTKAGTGVDTDVVNTACTDRTAGSAHTPSSPSSPTGNDCRSAGVRSTTKAADISIAKDMSLSPSGGWTHNLAVANTDGSYYIRLRVSNAAGGDLARTVYVTDAIPDFITSGSYVTAVNQNSVSSGSMSYNQWNGLVTWALSNLAAGATETLVIRVDRPFESGSYTNFASVFSPDTTETNNANNSDSANFSVGAVADMTINSKSVTPDPVRVGVPATYIISVRNDGANPADNVQVVDVIDPARFQITGTPSTTKPGASCSVVQATGTVTCAMGQFARTEVRQISIDVLPKYPFGSETVATLPITQANKATVTTSTLDANGGSDPNAGNNAFTLNHTVNGPAFDLAVTKTESDPVNDDPVRFDETLNYDIRVSNYGPSRATNVIVTDIPSPPAGLTTTLQSVTVNPVAANGGLSLQAAPNAGCTPSGATYVCRIDASNADANYLDPSRQVVFRLVFAIGGTPPSAPVTYSNAAEVTSAEQPVWNGTGADSQTANNRAVQTTTIRPSTDLQIVSKTRTGALMRNVNEPVEFTIRFRNNGPSTATRVRVTDVLPAGFVYAATPAPSTAIPGGSGASVSGLTCSGTTTITCDIDGSFPVGAAQLVDLKVRAKAQGPYSGALSPMDATDTATITPGLDGSGDPLSEDADNTNNSQSAVVQIKPSSIAGTVYADNNDNNVFNGGEGIAGVTVSLTGTDIYGNAVSATAITNASGAFVFDVLPPSDAAGYAIVETQPANFYDLNETAGSAGGTVNNAVRGNTPAENTIGGIVLAAQTAATGYLFQDHASAVIVAVNDNPPAVNGATGQTNIVNAFANDTFNNAAIDPAKIVTTIVTPATNPGVTMDTATGLVSVAPGTPAGTYTIDYRICDKADAATCATARVTVIVTASPVTATNDTISGINGATGAADVLSALTGDTVNGAAATTDMVTIAVATGSTVPSVLTFDTATGKVSVHADTPAGTYSFNYHICEKLNPANCAIATETVSVVAGAIAAVNDSATGINGAAGATGVLNVLTGDTRNGAAATTGTVTIAVAPGSTVPSELTFDTATGAVSVKPGTPAGTYLFNYRICETINPTNCATAEARVAVVAGVIAAANDTVGGVNGTLGGSNVLNVLAGDTLNGAPATTSTVAIALAPGATVPAGLTFDPATGNVSVAPNTPAGTYHFDYRICEKLNPTNCSTATATVTVVAAPITADDDASSPVTGATGAADVVDALDGDALNNAQAKLADVAMTVVTPATAVGGNPVPVLDTATGKVSVPAGTPSGTYTIDYRICEKLNPANCATARITVPVTAAAITAGNDSATGINGAAGGTGVLNVLSDDRLNGMAVTAGTVSIAVAAGSTVPAVLTFDPATGAVSVKPGTPAGTYHFDYTICEKLNPTNCATATASVTVVAAPIVATPDSATGINGASGAAGVLNVLGGDTLNGVAATTGTVTIAVASGASVPATLAFDPATGAVSVKPGTPAGTYSFDYTICEKLNPTNCATATASVTVVAAPIVATNDTVPPVNGGQGGAGVIDVLGNDTLNGAPADKGTVTISVVTPATPINGGAVPVLDPATGLVSVPADTPAGTYTIDYRICEKLNPTNCSTAKVTVPVSAGPITAKDDSATGINGASGATGVVNVLGGDTRNGAAATTATVTIGLAPRATLPAGLEFDTATGDVSVKPGTPAGTYSFDYQICEKLNPTNCATAKVSVTVIPAPIVAVDDTVSGINGGSGAVNVLNALGGDTLNGQPATVATVTLSLVNALPAGFTFDPATGNLGVAPGTRDGTYAIPYRICEKLNPTNCASATMTVTVIPPRSTVSGIVYLDGNLSRTHESSEALLEGWTVEVVRGGAVVGTTHTDAKGFYSIPDLLSGDGYSIRFRHAASGVVYGRIDSAVLPVNATLADQNMPIDPSGVVYDSVTRSPVPGAVVTLVDDGGVPLADTCFIDPGQARQVTSADGLYRFDIVAGAAAQCPAARTGYHLKITPPAGYSGPESTVIAAQQGLFNPAGRGTPAPVVANAGAPQASDPTTYFLGFLLGQGDGNVVNNHIPLDPFLSRTPLIVTKISDKRTANVGDLVPYTITVRNTEALTRAGVAVVDILPPGFRYVAGSARVEGLPLEPVANDRELRWNGQVVPGNTTLTYRIIAVIGAGVTEGDRVNTAVARSGGAAGAGGSDISNRAQAVVSIVPSTLFDCAEVIGKVYDDLNGNGYQDAGEPGIPAARLATVNGQLVTVDDHGRYHITCAAVPNALIGSNYVLKLDTRTVPEGYAPTTDNPQSIRLTRGKISELNFGVQRARVVAVAIDARAFASGSADLLPAFATRLETLKTIKAARLAIRATYTAAAGEPAALVEARLASLHDRIGEVFRNGWDGPPPVIEIDMIAAGSARTSASGQE